MYLLKNSYKIYKIRIRIPKRLQPFFNKTEINKSLHTKNYKDAIINSESIIRAYRKVELLHDTGLCVYDELTSIVNTFNSTFGLSEVVSQPNITTIKTHKSCFDEFKSYYKELSISDSKRNSLLNFLSNVYLPLADHKSPINSIDFNKLLSIKKQLEILPRRNIQIYRTMSLSKLLKLNVPDNMRVTVGTLQAYFGHIKRFYNYCKAQRYIEVNPADFITIETEVSSDTEREPFSKNEVSSLLKLIDKEDEFRRDIYYCFVYTGLRCSELWKAKLKYDETTSLWFFDLTDKNIKLKTLSSHRVIPLHKALVDIGIPQRFKQCLQKCSQDNIQKTFNNSIKIQVTNSTKKVMYSLRHTIATELKYAEVNPLVISELLGHSVQKEYGMTMSRYGSKYPLKVLKDAIDKLEFN